MKIHHLIAGATLALSFYQVSAAPAKNEALNCKLTIEGTDTMQYQVDGKKIESITVPLKCAEFVVTLKHTGKLPKQVMGHNFVLTASADADKINSEASKLGPDKGYLPDMTKEPFKSKVLALGDKLLSGGESEDIKINTKKLKKGGKYTYFCTFPGHYGMMQGKLIVN